MFCREYVVQLRDSYEEIRRRNARLVVIGSGRAEFARAFREDQRLTFDLWVDPEMKAYRAAGLRRGAFQAVSWRTPGHLWRALRKGFRQGRTRGDMWQLGGTFVITPKGEVRYAHIDREAGDHPSLSKVFAFLGDPIGKDP
jgi:peroxiredoxin